MTTLLQLRGIHHAYVTNTPVLSDFSLSVEQGEIACLLGASGCGKTTALRIIAGFEKPDKGKVELAGKVVSGSKVNVPVEKRSVGIVFQDAGLFPHLTVWKNIAFGLHGMKKAQRGDRVAEMLSLVGLESYGESYPHQLSGGQQQRIALARAMAPRPKLILLDEPFSNLDASLRETLGAELRSILKAHEMTAVLVTHDQREAFTMADRVAVVHAGKIRQWAPPQELFQEPRDKMVAAFLGLGSFIAGQSLGDGHVRCAFGTFKTVNKHLPPGPVSVLIRPENLVPDPDGIVLKLKSHQFCGANYRCDLQFSDDQQVQAWLPAEGHKLQTGTSIAVKHRTCPVEAFATDLEPQK